MSKTDYDLVIVGAGPAGMAAAAQAADAGLHVLLLDEQPNPGGQIYRDVDRVPASRVNILGKDYLEGQQLTGQLQHDHLEYARGASVWQVDLHGKVAYTVNGKGRRVAASRILLASGALERPMPIPGWTLPGVMTAGAAQILLKQSGLVSEQAVLAGSGPLLYLLAAQMVRAGKPPLALVETQTMGDFVKSARHLWGALQGWSYMAKGLTMLREIQSAKVPRFKGATALACRGEHRVQSFHFEHRGKAHELETTAVFLHHGVVPNIQASQSLRLAHHYDEVQQCFKPVTDEWGATSAERIYVAGDGSGIGGAAVAALSGKLAALKIAHDLERMDDRWLEQLAAPIKAQKRHELNARPFIDQAYPPYGKALLPDDDTIICRCEEVAAGDVRRYASLGCLGPNQTKAFGRVGMGPCQGRYCGLTASQILAQSNGLSMQETGYYRIRPPLKPITMGELATVEPEQDELPPLESL